MKNLMICVLMGLVFPLVSFSQTNYYVDVSLNSGSQTALSWSNASNDLQNVINIANSGDIIHIQQGNYFTVGSSTSFEINKNLTLIGGYIGSNLFAYQQGSCSQTVITGDFNATTTRTDDSWQLLKITGSAVVNISGISFTSNNSVNNLSAVSVSSGAAINIATSCFNNCTGSLGGALGINSTISPLSSIVDCDFANNEGHHGGALSHGNSLIIQNTLFQWNHATQAGGAIYSTGDLTLVDRGTFGNNSCDGDGGAIYTLYCGLYINSFQPLDPIVFATNSAQNGAAIYDYGSMGNIDLYNVTFANNHAAIDGGCIYSEINTTTIENSLFINNSASANGGSIYSRATSTVIIQNNTTFTQGSAVKGGAIYSLGNLQLTSCSLTVNTASHSGGAIWADQQMTINSGLLHFNTATLRGGAIFTNNKATIFSTNITNNTVTSFNGEGGAVYCDKISAASSLFKNSIAKNGAGIFAISKADITNNCRFEDNAATQFGGGLYVSNGNINCYNSFFENNEAYEGGAIYGIDPIYINDSEFKSNSCIKDGGAINGDVIGIEDSRFESNSCNNRGGAIYSSVNIEVFHTEFEGNESVFEPSTGMQNGQGGAIYAYGLLTSEWCTFQNNSSWDVAGAIAMNHIVIHPNRPNLIDHSFFENNSSRALGAALLLNTKVLNSVFKSNNSVYLASSIYLANSEAVNCTFYDNVSSDPSGTSVIIAEVGDIRNSIIWGNNITGNATIKVNSINNGGIDNVTNNIIEGGFTKPVTNTLFNIINQNPNFVNPSSDLRLQAYSPAINYGVTADNPSIVTDIAGNQRVHDCSIDIGAYEKHFTFNSPLLTTPAKACIGDNVTFFAPIQNGLTYVLEEYIPPAPPSLVGNWIPVSAPFQGGPYVITANYPGQYRFSFYAGNPACSNSTNSVYLDVFLPSGITTQPTDLVACQGNSATLYANASTSGTHDFQWQCSSDNIMWNALPGETSPTLTRNNVSGTFWYRMRINYGENNVNNCVMYTNSAKVTVKSPTMITTQPNNSYACEGTTAVFNVVTGSGSFTYQWQKFDGMILPGSWVNVGTNSTNLSVPMVNSYTSTKYRVIVTETGSPCPPETSIVANLYVSPNPTISMALPGNVDLCTGDNHTFTINASVASPSSYIVQWYENSVLKSTTSGNSYTTSAAPSMSPVKALVINTTTGCQSVTSTNVNVMDYPIISSGLMNQTICSGNSANLDVIAAPASIYDWFSSSNNAGPWTPLTSPVGSTFSPNPTVTTYYKVEVSNGHCSVSSIAKVTVTSNPLPLIVSTEKDETCDLANGSISLTVPTTGSYTYLWSPSGSTSSSLTGLVGQGSMHQVKVTNSVTGCFSTRNFTIFSGNTVPTWPKHQATAAIQGGGVVESNAIAIDKGGYYYTTGTYRGEVNFGFDASGSSVILKNNTNLKAVFVAKYNSCGVEWVKDFGVGTQIEAVDVAIDFNTLNPDVYISGYFEGSVNFGSITLNSNNNSTDIFIARLRWDGFELSAINAGGTGNTIETAGDIVSHNGRVFYTGTAAVNSDIYGPPISHTTQAFVAEIDPANLTLQSSYWVDGYSSGISLAMYEDANSNELVAISGTFNSNINVNSTNYMVNGEGMYVLTLDVNGAISFNSSISSVKIAGSDVIPTKIIASGDFAYVSGYFSNPTGGSTEFEKSNGTNPSMTLNSSPTLTSSFICKYDIGGGTNEWFVYAGGSPNKSVAITFDDINNKVIAIGKYENNIDFKDFNSTSVISFNSTSHAKSEMYTVGLDQVSPTSNNNWITSTESIINSEILSSGNYSGDIEWDANGYPQAPLQQDLFTTGNFYTDNGNGFLTFPYNNTNSSQVPQVLSSPGNSNIDGFIVRQESSGNNHFYKMSPKEDETVNYVEELEIEEWKAYPNPFSNEIQIELGLEELEHDLSIKIIDNSGRIVLEQIVNEGQSGSVQISTNHLASGSYVLQLENGSDVKRTSLVKTR